GFKMSDGCNRTEGAYASADDRTLLTGHWLSTLNTCPGDDSANTQRFHEGLRRIAVFERPREDSLRLYSLGAVVRVLVLRLTYSEVQDHIGNSAAPLADTEWMLVAYGSVNEAPVPVVVPPESFYGPYTLQFHLEGGGMEYTPDHGFRASNG